jgi:hypothetical protein
MPTNIIFDDGIIDMYTRDEANEKFLTKQEFIDACVQAGLITGVVDAVALGSLAYVLYTIYESAKTQKETGNASVTGQYTGAIPVATSTANYSDPGQTVRPKLLEIECEWLTPTSEPFLYGKNFLGAPIYKTYNDYLYGNKWVFPFRIRFNWNMYLLKGENGKDRECRCDKEGRIVP